jgi:hypothetical protein
MSKYLQFEPKTCSMTFKEIQKDWDGTKLFIKILFLMDKLKVSQGEAVKVANLKFTKLSKDYKNAIHKSLNY